MRKWIVLFLLGQVFAFQYHFHCQKSSSVSLQSSLKSAQQLRNSEDIHLLNMVQLRQLYKALGGRPSNLRKYELVELCTRLNNANATQKMQFSSEKKEASKLPSISAFMDKLEPVDINSRMIPRSRLSPNESVSSTSNPQPDNRQESDPSQYRSQPRKFTIPRFPVGEFRNSRFDGLEGSDMDVTFLGTASCSPSISRGVSCTAVRYNSDLWLFDCGESVQIQFQRSLLKPSKVKKIFITHCHGDHFFGLGGMLCFLGQANQERIPDEEPLEPIDIYGPEGTRNYIRAVMQASYSRVASPYRVHELKDIPYLHSKFMRKPYLTSVSAECDARYGERPGSDIYPDRDGIFHLLNDENGLTVKAAPMQHTVPCVGFVVTESDQNGSLRVDKVKDLVESNKDQLSLLPEFKGHYLKVNKILKSLQPEQSFTFPNGETVYGHEVNEPKRKGRKVVIMGDTCNGSMIAPIAKDADLLVHEATNAFLPYDIARGKNPQMVTKETMYHGHSTPQMAAAFAQSINARRLILTHFSARYSGLPSEPAMRDMWAIEDLARSKCHLKGDNDVIAAWDFMNIPVPIVRGGTEGNSIKGENSSFI